ncbi:MAG: arginine--tRNA ligase [Candidatus Methanomethylophilaceae archaeon]|nr:arginyl-tRNA synthetase [Methanomassiliicoccales archaeon RumEn M2]MDD2779447.1 arginine--tRNA ligase [Candidatus Methanomethylophilaceae archaeon]MDD3128237.1 arginine--tRNA ligase [Candidatus Methanomethylophilaceae archaeon]MDD4119631.1 arginine--tRNA ligase [Candidatus Methanomethylophilaceae archaeon]MDI9378452.1 arginine--tRNA ligase [Candidatus Thermoplasmatota archaeon]
MSVHGDFEEEVRKATEAALGRIGAAGAEYRIERPSAGNADLAVPCFQMSKSLRKAPNAIAEEMAAATEPSGMIASVDALNGYLNFTIDSDVLMRRTIDEILESDECYGGHRSNGIKVNVEHTSTNPTGPIHVGRARNPIIGDTLARAMRLRGYDVTTEYYVNDVGKQVVILTWGVNNIPPEDVEKADREKADHALVAFYRAANRMMESDPEVQEEIADLLRRFEAGDSKVISDVRETAQRMLDGLKETLERINVELDVYTWESRFIADGTAKSVVEQLTASDYAGKEEDGACYLDLKDFGIQGKNTKFTFTRSDGTTLYTTRDLAYHLDKFKRADRVIDVLGEDQKLGSKQLCSALEILGCERKPEALFYSFVSLPEGKMSTRKGVVVYLDDLIDEAVARAYEEIRSRRTDLSEERMREIASTIGVGAIRYNIVRVQPEKQLVFKWEDALNFDGNSGPFLQYSHTRACSMLRKAGEFKASSDASKLTDEYEVALIKVLSRFGSVIEEAAEEGKVHMIPAYGHEVASAFNQFYASVPVLSSDDERDERLTLVLCTRIVLRNVLTCLGMGAPEEM